MKKFFYSKAFIAIIFFCIGFLSNHYLSKLSAPKSSEIAADRFPVDPNDFDHDKMLDAIKRMQDQTGAGLSVGGVDRREDKDFVYYDIPLKPNEKDHQLKVKVKDGMISISENTPNTESEREFSIDQGLDESNAQVITDKDKVCIKIPKINK